MPYVFNPFTGNFDYYKAGSGPSSGDAERVKDTFVAGQNLSALRMVKRQSDGRVVYANPSSYSSAQSIGLTLNSALEDDSVEVLHFGEVQDASFSFGLDDNIFLGTLGMLTNIAPTSGISARVGKAVGVDRVFIDIDEIIELA